MILRHCIKDYKGAISFWYQNHILDVETYAAALLFQIQRNVQSLVPTVQHNAQSYSSEGRPGASAQTSSSRDVMRRYEGDDVTVAVIQGLASLTSRTGTLVVIVGGLVRILLHLLFNIMYDITYNEISFIVV